MKKVEGKVIHIVRYPSRVRYLVSICGFHFSTDIHIGIKPWRFTNKEVTCASCSYIYGRVGTNLLFNDNHYNYI